MKQKRGLIFIVLSMFSLIQNLNYKEIRPAALRCGE